MGRSAIRDQHVLGSDEDVHSHAEDRQTREKCGRQRFPALDTMTEIGASIHGDGVFFRVWAGHRRTVTVLLNGRSPVPLRSAGDGYFEALAPRLGPGSRYRYLLDDDVARPDPASRHQPDGVHGASAVVDPGAFPWTDDGFRGHALADLVIYELHVGTFTTAGTFEAVISHLSYLVDLGVTAIELMPVAQFPGSRNWGYDGVYLFAPQSTYGGPAGLRKLVNACHEHGLSVLLDVVYNHLGPEGNYLGDFGPYFTDRYPTPWGAAINYDGDDAAGVRNLVSANAAHWIREYHIDGLRLDAIHSIFDASPVSILSDIAATAEREGQLLQRPVHVMAESHDNDRRIVLPRERGGLGLGAVWSDDFHHALHAHLTGERRGYYQDFGRPEQLARSIAEGFAFQGEQAEYWGRPRGTPSADLPGEAFAICVQNHDQVGNRADGERLGQLVAFDAVKLAAALLLSAPALPVLFMGEEYGETAPFQFFTSFLDLGLAAAVRRGRAEDLTRQGWPTSGPDPGDHSTFMRSHLNPALRRAPRHRELLAYYRRWLELRRKHGALGARGKDRMTCALDAGGAVIVLERRGLDDERILLAGNLTAERVVWTPPAEPWRVLLDSATEEFGGAHGGPPLRPYQVILYEFAV
jgi:maltooligosyltrehalose trehalohydrolase